jgi:hypothetical protein
VHAAKGEVAVTDTDIASHHSGGNLERRRASGTNPSGIGSFILTVIEAGAFTWWLFNTQYNIINAISHTANSSNYRLSIKISIATFILFAYVLSSHWLIKNMRWLAFLVFGLLWACVGFQLAEYFGGNDSWKLGAAAVLGLMVVGEKHLLYPE